MSSSYYILNVTVTIAGDFCCYDSTENCSPKVNNFLLVAESNIHFSSIILFEHSEVFDTDDHTFPLETLYYFLIFLLYYWLLLLSLFC